MSISIAINQESTCIKDASRRIDHTERPPQICFFMGRAMDQVNRVTVHFSHQAPGRSLPAVHRRHDIPWRGTLLV